MHDDLLLLRHQDYRAKLVHHRVERIPLEIDPLDDAPRESTFVPAPKLAVQFSRLTSDKDIDAFAREFGLLGLAEDQPDNVWSPPNYGMGWVEDLSLWRYHIAVVRRLLRLYYILKRGGDQDIYDAETAAGGMLRLEGYQSGWWGWVIKDSHLIDIDGGRERVRVVWVEDNQDTGVRFDPEISLLEAAAVVLVTVLSRMLQGGVNLDYSRITPAKKAIIGYRVTEQKTTPYLLTAIYHDLWQMVTEERPVVTCDFCGMVIEKSGRGKYCNNACRQAAYRVRKKFNLSKPSAPGQ